ncbi:hypothetical protein HWA77_10310, partial [Photobacterium damselae subsp. damselae]|nr:hypothetical protein [Photobacterium damselae subsp. damselae]
DKLEISKQVYQLSWQPNIEKLDTDRCLATGYSCRSQVKRFEKIQFKHPVQAILSQLKLR